VASLVWDWVKGCSGQARRSARARGAWRQFGAARPVRSSRCPSEMIISEINRLLVRKNLLLVDKKKQKNFVNLELEYSLFRLCVPALLNRSFLLLFFKQEAFLLHFNALISLIIFPDGHSGSSAIRPFLVGQKPELMDSIAARPQNTMGRFGRVQIEGTARWNIVVLAHPG